MLTICKQDAQLWNDLLWVSGGMLELKKCSYHLVNFNFEADGTPVVQTHFPEPDDLALIDAKTGQSVTLKRKTVFEPHKTLGHCRAPAGKGQTQLQALKKNSLKLVEQALRCPMNPNEALRHCNCVCVKSMEHALPQSFFDPKQLDTIDRKAQQIFARGSGLSGSMSLAMRYGPEELAGAAMTQLSTMQGEGQILNFLKHWRSCSNVGKVLRIALAWCQMQAGEFSQPTSFTRHLESLSESDQELFADVELLEPTTTIATHDKLMFVHDGSSSEKTMSFGWVLAAPDGTRLAKCSGPVFGRSSSSCRSETHGMLSAVRFALQLCKHHNNIDTIEFQLASDNQSMLDKIDEMMECDAPCPNETLTSDWDVLVEIKHAMLQFTKRPTTAWVKGHQDDKKDYEDLDLEAQLNVDADWLAGAHARIWPTYRPKVPRLPNNAAQLHTNGKTITSHCSKEIRHAAHYQQPCNCIKRKNKWSQSAADSVDWPLMKAALQRDKHRRTFLIKVCHNILPLGEIAKHCDKSEPTTCTFCGHDNDNFVHLLSCTHKSVVEWRKAFRTELTRCAAHLTTRPGLINVLLQGIDTMMAPRDTTTQSGQHADGIKLQNDIGWEQMLQGKWTNQWAALQDEHCEFSGDKSNHNAGQLWAAKILSKIWDQLHQLWTQRNEHKHGKENSTQETTKKARAIKAVEELHLKKKDMLVSDHVHLIDNVAAWAKPKESSHLINWINIWSPLIDASVRAATDFGLQQTDLITNCFISHGPRTEHRPPKQRHSRKHGRHENPNRVARERRRPPSFTKHTTPRLFAGHSRPIIPDPT